MSRDDISPTVARQLAKYLPTDDYTRIATEELIDAMRYARSARDDLQVVVGTAAAELHRRDPRNNSWRAIADRVGMPHATLRRWALPFVTPTGPTPDTPTP
jgi:hypothetical protein